MALCEACGRAKAGKSGLCITCAQDDEDGTLGQSIRELEEAN